MKINTKTRYGIRTMLEIALKKSLGGILQKDIAENQNISFKYLDQIISSLKSAGLITNAKGKKSGYILTRAPEKITIYDIYKAFGPEINIVECLSEHIHCPDEQHCASRDFWEGLNSTIISYMEGYTLKELVDRQLNYAEHS